VEHYFLDMQQMDKSTGFRAFMILIVVVVIVALIALYRNNHFTKSESFNTSLEPQFPDDPYARIDDGYDNNSYGPYSVLNAKSQHTQHAQHNQNTQQSSYVEQPKSCGAAPLAANVLPSEELENEQYRAVDFGTGNTESSSTYPQRRLTTDDLLPKDAANTKWAQVTPSGQGELRDLNFMTAGWHIGVNTQGQSLRNANLQLRSEPINPQFKVSPWNMSTVEPDVSRRPFEIV